MASCFGLLVDLFARLVKGACHLQHHRVDRFRFASASLAPALFDERLLEPLYNVGCVLRAFALFKSVTRKLLTVAGKVAARELEKMASDLGDVRRNLLAASNLKRCRRCMTRRTLPDGDRLDNMPSRYGCVSGGLARGDDRCRGHSYIVRMKRRL